MERAGSSRTPLSPRNLETTRSSSDLDYETNSLQSRVTLLLKKSTNELHTAEIKTLNDQINANEHEKRRIADLAAIRLVRSKSVCDKILLSKIQDASQNFLTAAKSNDIAGMKEVESIALQHVKDLYDKNIVDENNTSPLHLACFTRMKMVIKYLISVGCNFSVIPLNMILKKDHDGLSLLHYLLNDKALIKPILLHLSALRNGEEMIMDELRSVIQLDYNTIERNLCYAVREIGNPLPPLIAKFKSELDAKIEEELSAWAALDNAEEEIATTSPIISIIIDGIKAHDITELRNFLYAQQPPLSPDIEILIDEIKKILKDHGEPLSDTLQLIKNTLQFYENLSGVIYNIHGHNTPDYKILQTALYITENIANKPQQDSAVIVQPNDRLPFPLLIERDSIDILPYDIKRICSQLSTGSSVDLNKIVFKKPPYIDKFIKCLLSELSVILQNDQIPAPWNLLYTAYEQVSKIGNTNNITENLQNAILLIEHFEKFGIDLDQVTNSIQTLAKAVIISRDLDRGNIIELRSNLKSLNESEITIFIAEFKKMYTLKNRIIKSAWKFLNDVIQKYETANSPNYQLFQKIASVELNKKFCNIITANLDKNDISAFIKILEMNQQLDQDELTLIVEELKRSPSLEDSLAWQTTKETIKEYEIALANGKPVDIKTIQEAFIKARGKTIVDFITKDLERDNESGIVNKLRSALKSKPALIKSEIAEIIDNIKRISTSKAVPTAQLLDNILQRYEQISGKKIEKGRGVASYENMLLAINIEYDLKLLGKKTAEIFQEITDDVPRPLYSVDSGRSLTIWARNHKVSIIRGEGSYKRILSAIVIPFDDIRANVERVVVASLKRPETDLKVMQDEIKILKKLKGIDGILQLHSVLEFREPNGVNICCLLQECEENIEKLYKEVLPNLQNQLSIAKQLVGAVDAMHKLNVIHWDIKRANIARIRESVVLMDFGMAFELGNDHPKCPSYGSPLYSAPELIYLNRFRINRQGSEFYKQAEILSLGIVLYRLHFKDDFPYANPEKKDYAQFEEEYLEKIEKPLALLLQKEGKTPEDDYKILIYEMIRLQPGDRISTEKALLELHSEKYSQLLN